MFIWYNGFTMKLHIFSGLEQIMYDIGIENGLVYRSGLFEKLNLYITEEKISLLTKEKLKCHKQIDATGKYILPGFIDPHVHFSLGVGTRMTKDDFLSGSVEGIMGGVTTFIDFLDPVKKSSEILPGFEKRQQLAMKSMADYAFHGTIANPTDSAKELIDEYKKIGINSIKLFTTYADTDRRTMDSYIYQLLEASKKENCIVVVHAENDDLIDKSKEIPIKEHERSRPVSSENTEVLKLAQMARQTQGRLYIVHVSAGSTVKLMVEKYLPELKSHQIILESCPHYFLLNSERLADEDGYKYAMTPPLRPESERLLLNEYHQYITNIGTDHCSYQEEQKKHLFTSEVAMGIGGIRYSFLNMFQLFGFSILDKFTSGPSGIYGLDQKGSLDVGKDADVVIFNENEYTKVEDSMSIYNGSVLNGAIESVFIRGTQVFTNGKIISHQGNYIRR